VNLFSAATDITFLITRRRHSAPQTRSFYLYQLIKQRFKTQKHSIKNKKINKLTTQSHIFYRTLC